MHRDGRRQRLHLDGKGRRAVSERSGCSNRGPERPVAAPQHPHPHHRHHHLLYVTGEVSLMQSHVKAPLTTTTPTERPPSVSWENILVQKDFTSTRKIYRSFKCPLRCLSATVYRHWPIFDNSHSHYCICFSFFIMCPWESTQADLSAASHPGLFCVAFNAPQLWRFLKLLYYFFFPCHRCNIIRTIKNNNKKGTGCLGQTRSDLCYFNVSEIIKHNMYLNIYIQSFD